MHHTHDKEYDVIFAGGGTSACVAAGRLATADPSLRILVLEQGPHSFGREDVIQPARYLGHIRPESKTVSFHVSKPSEKTGNRPLIIPSGQCVGGGSSVNFMMYTRASASDYDDWENVYRNAGWGSKDLIPLLKKTETYQVQPNMPTHGYSGPLKVSYGGQFTNIGKDFLDTGLKYDKTRAYTDDANDLFVNNAYGRWAKWIDGETGRRSDAAHHFIYNQQHNKNLHVLDGRKVKRVIIENNRAVGVEFLCNPAVHPDADVTVQSARATNLVVVSGGAFGSPAILERSGIGAKSILERNGVQPVVDLPGVGENYQDHNLVVLSFHADDEAETHDAIFKGTKEEIDKHLAPFKEGKGLMAHNTIDAGIKLRPDAEELRELGPEFEARWRDYYANAPDKAVLWLGLLAAFMGDHSTVPPGKYYTIGFYTTYPMALGRVHIQSGENVDTIPDFECGYFEDEADVALIRWGLKKAREIGRRMRFFRGELQAGHPQFSEDSPAACIAASEPVDIAAPDIKYSAEDEKAIEHFIRTTVRTSWHSLGTCAMKPREKGGVVDSHLNVYGVEGLKVVDLSIAPGNVGANTYSTALVTGEKAAILIAAELGIEGV